MNTIIIVSVLLAVMILTFSVQNVFANHASHKAISKIKGAVNKGLNQLNDLITPTTNTTCLNNTSTVGPWTNYFNMVKGIYHCQTFDVTVLHESPTSVMLHYEDSDKAGTEGAVQEEAGVLNWHTLSQQDDGVITTEVLVPNP